jgi:hypothetical protein
VTETLAHTSAMLHSAGSLCTKWLTARGGGLNSDTDGVIMLSAGWRHTRFWWEQMNEGEQLEGVNTRITLKWIISKWVEGREVD